jgi:mono/diheme cytochrome c family protein
MTTLATLVSERLVTGAPAQWTSAPPRIRATSPTTRAVLGYFAANCGTCHNRSGETTFDGPSLKHSDILDGDAVASGLLGYATAWQVPGQPEGASRMLSVAPPDASAMLARMRSRRPSSQMPPLGTNLRDDAAIDIITRWMTTDLSKR